MATCTWYVGRISLKVMLQNFQGLSNPDPKFRLFFINPNDFAKILGIKIPELQRDPAIPRPRVIANHWDENPNPGKMSRIPKVETRTIRKSE